MPGFTKMARGYFCFFGPLQSLRLSRLRSFFGGHLLGGLLLNYIFFFSMNPIFFSSLLPLDRVWRAAFCSSCFTFILFVSQPARPAFVLLNLK